MPNTNGKPNPLLKKSKSKKEWLENAAELKTNGMKFTSLSGEPVEVLYTPEDVKDIDYDKEIAYPGEFPYTRGIHPNLYRGNRVIVPYLAFVCVWWRGMAYRKKTHQPVRDSMQLIQSTSIALAKERAKGKERVKEKASIPMAMG